MIVSGTSRLYGSGPRPAGAAEKSRFARRLGGPGTSARGGDEPAAQAKAETKASRNGTDRPATPLVLLPSAQFAAQVIGQVLPARTRMSRQALRSYADAAGICGANFEIEVV